ncbi:fungal protease inhibitor F-like [Bombyx mandarina]|uniref:Fungal protease inhibitor F-like n=1 Tax=Bombyx mandarina TaxID=7092 RepID=A0A6J2JIF3_BOMMA|nr:fungal protease inhibitor F-like [Bombyx mandarina]
MASKNLFVLFLIFALFATNVAGQECPENTEVVDFPCPRTCDDPYGENTCITGIQGRCHCKGALVFNSDNVCVPIFEC